MQWFTGLPRRKSKEVEEDIVREKNKQQASTGSQSRCRRRSHTPGTATDRELAVAFGRRPPIPTELLPSKTNTLKARKSNARSHATGQAMLDREASGAVRKSLFKSKGNSESSSSNSESSGDSDVRIDDSPNTDDVENELECHEVETPRCSCDISKFVERHSSPTTLGFLRDLTFLFENNGDLQNSKYLPLLTIPDNVKKVELFHGKGVFIASSDKETLRVDFRNKAPSLIRETLYILYGKKAFQTFHVTARGQKQGSYGIQEDVLKALHGFVNHNLDTDKKLKFTDMVASINKRAPEWRSGRGLLYSTEKKKKNIEHGASPFSPMRSSPLEMPSQDSEEESPATSPEKTAQPPSTPLPVVPPVTWDQDSRSHQSQDPQAHQSQLYPAHQSQLHQAHQSHQSQLHQAQGPSTSWHEWNMYQQHQQYQYEEHPTYQRL